MNLNGEKVSIEELEYKMHDDVPDFSEDNVTSRIEQIRNVVKQHQCAKIEGVLMDATTANLVCNVWDRLGLVNQDKLSQISMSKMVDMCWKLYNKK